MILEKRGVSGVMVRKSESKNDQIGELEIELFDYEKEGHIQVEEGFEDEESYQKYRTNATEGEPDSEPSNDEDEGINLQFDIPVEIPACHRCCFAIWPSLENND